MRENERRVCIIPARSGSKGLKNKNMLFLEGKPLIFHTIDAAIESGVFKNEDIYVSTDSVLYKEIIESSRPITVLLRKPELSTDKTTTFEVLEDFLKDFNEDVEFMLCQPTSPLRGAHSIREAYKTFQLNECDNLVSFSEADKSLRLFSTIDQHGCPIDVIGIDKGYRRQGEEKIYYPNGALFISKKKCYLETKSFFTKLTKAYIMNKEESVDIDNKEDFISVLGNKFFNYQNRELNNKKMYKKYYEEFSKIDNKDKIIIGDSRMKNIAIKEFTNISIDGVTLNTAYDNIEKIISENTKEVFVSVGINDLRVGYSIDNIKLNMEKIVDILRGKNIKVTISEIIYTLFRFEVDNDKILKLNEFINELGVKKSINVVNPNLLVCNNNNLQFKYTYDGLHINEKGNEALIEFYNNQFV